MCQVTKQAEHPDMVKHTICIGTIAKMPKGEWLRNSNKDWILRLKCTHPSGASEIHEVKPGEELNVGEEEADLELLEAVPV